jgi:chitinase
MAAATVTPARATPAESIVGYVFPQGATLQPGEIDPGKLTRINYAFANIENGRVVQGFKTDAVNLAFLRGLKRQNPNLTILISIGGWLWSTHFSDVALTAQSRAVFIQSAVAFLKANDLDGIDIDWEYPGMAGAGHPLRAEDKQNFTLLLKDLRTALDGETAKTHRRLYLTIAAAASDEFLAHTEMGRAQRFLDTVNLMAYDYYEPDSDAMTGHHAPLFASPGDPHKASADASVEAYEKAGVPAAKILLGVPFYGHAWAGVADRKHGLYQPGKPAPGVDASYQEIAATMLNHGYVRYWDAAADAPYLYNAAKQIFVSYEDPESLAAKCQYVKSHKLGGVMFWQYGNDPSEALLKTIYDSLESGVQTKEPQR